MPTYKMISPEILEITHTPLAFTKVKPWYFYTNIKTWDDLTNPAASKQTDNFRVARPLSESAIQWTKQYYLPNVVNKGEFDV